ncbi:MAG: serine/threonine protein kinase [Nannocystaceae bacterium]|nr:serine/threonine protein kinase [bacterium]
MGDATVEERIAIGATAIVYRGRRADGSQVAIKVGTAASDSDRTEHRFVNEARLSSAVPHPCIVPSIAYGKLDGPTGFEGRMFVIFPFVEGSTLSSEMVYHHQGMPEPRIRVLGKQLVDTLGALHDAGIVHRDIKPANLIVSDADDLHLVDFGLAYALGTGGVEKTDDVTLRGAAPGTTSYMSPQQLVHAEASTSFDVFALGATLFEFLSGSPPEDELSEDEVASRRRSADWSPPRLDVEASEELVEITMRCLAYAPQERPGIDELREFFEDVAPTTRIVLDQSAESESSSLTSSTQRPRIVADGARPAGDETLAKLVRDEAQLPSVRRVHTELEKARRDERIELPKTQAIAALELRTAERRARAERDAPSATGPETRPRAMTRKHAIAFAGVLVALFVSAVVGTWLALPAEERSTNTESRGNDGSSPASMVRESTPPRAEPSPKPDLGDEANEDTPDSEARPLPAPAPAPEPVSEPRKRPNRKSTKLKPRTPAPALPEVEPPSPEDSAACEKSRSTAQRAGSARAVLRATSSAKCWRGHEESRRYLRTQAFLDVQDYEACVRAGQHSNEADTRAFVRICKTKLKDSP